MKKQVVFFAALLSVLAGFVGWSSPAQAYWGYRYYEPVPVPVPVPVPAPRYQYHFRPRFSVSLSGGLHFVDTFSDRTYPLTFAMAELGTHLWVHPNLSIDLNVGTHFVTNYDDIKQWGYLSIKPGLRAKFGLFYLRGALDLAISGEKGQRSRPILFGFLLGVGIRVPVGHRVRLFGEVDYQFLFSDLYHLPFYGQLGVEVVF